jgi:hypothetical protein
MSGRRALEVVLGEIDLDDVSEGAHAPAAPARSPARALRRPDYIVSNAGSLTSLAARQ